MMAFLLKILRRLRIQYQNFIYNSKNRLKIVYLVKSFLESITSKLKMIQQKN